jgi:hypothetical protein
MILRSFWDFWARPIRGESLALFRILLAVTILGSQLTGIWRTLGETCAPDGYCPIESNDEWTRSTYRLSLLRGPVTPGKAGASRLPLLGEWLPDWLVEDYPRLKGWQNWVSPETARAWDVWGKRLDSHYLLFALFLVSLVTLALGLGTRLSALAAALLAATFHHRLPWLMNGGDSLFRNGLYFLILAPAAAAWSLDRVIARRFRRLLGWPVSDEPVLIAPWSVRLMQIQVGLMYLFTGLYKLSDADYLHDWLRSLFGLAAIGEEKWGDYIDGQALYWVFNDVAITRWPYALVPVPFVLCQVMTWGTMAFEIGFSFFVWIRPLRRWVLLAGVLLHLGILMTMEIGWFSQVTLCWYVLFVPGERVKGVIEQFGLWLRGKPPEAAPVRLAA